MSRTDRDMDRWFWKNHFRWYRDYREDLHSEHGGYYWQVGCECDLRPDHWMWAHEYRHEQGIPSWWKRDQRRQERAHARNMMDRARSGHLDWDDLSIEYRRPWFW